MECYCFIPIQTNYRTTRLDFHTYIGVGPLSAPTDRPFILLSYSQLIPTLMAFFSVIAPFFEPSAPPPTLPIPLAQTELGTLTCTPNKVLAQEEISCFHLGSRADMSFCIVVIAWSQPPNLLLFQHNTRVPLSLPNRLQKKVTLMMSRSWNLVAKLGDQAVADITWKMLWTGIQRTLRNLRCLSVHLHVFIPCLRSEYIRNVWNVLCMSTWI
jgi:hypothetical protein